MRQYLNINRNDVAIFFGDVQTYSHKFNLILQCDLIYFVSPMFFFHYICWRVLRNRSTMVLKETFSLSFSLSWIDDRLYSLYATIFEFFSELYTVLFTLHASENHSFATIYTHFQCVFIIHVKNLAAHESWFLFLFTWGFYWIFFFNFIS